MSLAMTEPMPVFRSFRGEPECLEVLDGHASEGATGIVDGESSGRDRQDTEDAEGHVGIRVDGSLYGQWNFPET